MVIRLFFIAFVVLLLALSAEGGSNPPDANSAEGIVFKVYKDFAWEAIMAESSDGLLQQPREVLEKYFDDKLTGLILQDRACAEKQGMCRLDFSPIWASQDPSAGDLTVEKTQNPNLVKVKFRYPSTDEKVELEYRVTMTKKGWRISDIVGKQWSLIRILSSTE